ncbi:MAG: hypothetical protein KDC34_01285 [Saprospiraceae bacterium]|nr:hypothetical protein [Saprospiraceae bacterium]
MKYFTVTCSCLFFVLNLSGQTSLSEVNYDRIPKKKVCQLIENLQKKDGLHNFTDLHSTCCDNPEEYHTHYAEYLVEADLETVWQAYNSVSPAKAWNGKMVGFGMLYSSAQNGISYLDDSFSGIEVGQLVFINLKILLGIVNVPVVIEITGIDKEQHMLQFCYADCSKSEGTQILHFFSTPEGFTRVEHLSYFRSDSKMRDKNLYPFFHTKVLNEFHGNIAKLLK